MKTRTTVGLALFLAYFVAGNILIFGLVSLAAFPLAYSLFALVTLAIIVLSLRKMCEQKYDLVIMIFLGLLLMSSLTFFASSAKSYYEKSGANKSAYGESQALLSPENKLVNEIDYILQKKQYDMDYIDYQLALLSQYQNYSQALQFQADALGIKSTAVQDSTIKELQKMLNLTREQLLKEIENEEEQARVIAAQAQTLQAYEDLVNQASAVPPAPVYPEEEDDN